MQIRYGFDIALDLAQPTAILTLMDVHSDVRCGVVEESELELAPVMPAERFVDDSGNIVRRLSAPAGVAYALTSVVSGNATSTVKGVTIDKLLAGKYSINVHKSTSDMGTYVACGDIVKPASM